MNTTNEPSPGASRNDVYERERAAEQTVVDRAYRRLDEARQRTAEALHDVQSRPTTGTPAALAERDAFAQLHTDRLAALEAVEDRLCFGRLDVADEAIDGVRGQDGVAANDEVPANDAADRRPAALVQRHIGRIGLSDESGDQILVDWRAPAAEPFYRATAAHPQGVARRRHLSVEERAVVSVEDDVLDSEQVDPDTIASTSGEGALMAALGAHRTGQMRDIVATIQAEQDEIVRAPLAGVLVVQGGPGTGKTAVALHRAAYLLYTHRERIAKSGVLLVGPSKVFLRYVEQVLPALGETGVLMRTVGELYPGIVADRYEDPAVAALKGDPRMARLVRSAVRARQRLIDEPRALDVDGVRITMRPRDVKEARDRARSNGKPHNRARVDFVRDLLGRLAAKLAQKQGLELDADTRSELLATLRESRDVRREVNLCWMPLTPQQVLDDLFTDPFRRAGEEHELTEDELALLVRDRAGSDSGGRWSAADVALLDEAAELLGEDDTADRLVAARAAAERRQEVAYAQQVAETSGGGIVTAEDLVDRYAAGASLAPMAERAAGDRTWTFGHVVVDEAQELSAMTWRMLMRRCPSRSMTVVGDVDQTSTSAGARAWADVLDPHVAGRWTLMRLSVNYRTPREVMDLAAAVLLADRAVNGGETHVPTSVRDATWPPRAAEPSSTDLADLVEVVLGAARADLDALGGGTVAVVTTRGLRPELSRALDEAMDAGTPSTSDPDASVRVLDVAAAKGLEFDAVVLVEPTDIVEESARGVNDLYVAMTRPTQRLTVVHNKPLPPGFEALGQD